MNDKLYKKLFGPQKYINILRKRGIKIGRNTNLFSILNISEPYLLEIGEHCTISTNVTFITHDSSIGALYCREEKSDLCGKITIGNNCFIGANSTILYGVTLGDRTIVAAGSVVTKSFSEPGCIVGGNPAKKIGIVSDYIDKYKDNFLSLHGLSSEEKKKEILNTNKLISN